MRKLIVTIDDRLKRFAVWFLFLVLLSFCFCYMNPHEKTMSFEQLYEANRSMSLVVLLGLLMLCYWLVLARMDDRTATRIMMLPMDRRYLFLCDSNILFICSLILVGILFLSYSLSFYEYISKLDDRQIIMLHQTRDLLVSLSRCELTAPFFAQGLFPAVHMGLVLFTGALTAPILGVAGLHQHHWKRRFYFMTWLCLFFFLGLSSVVSIGIRILVLLAICIWAVHRINVYTNHNQMGGK